MAMTLPVPRAEAEDDGPARLDDVLSGFESAWRAGPAPSLEDWLGRLDPSRPADATELIYAAFCLADADGLGPDPADYLARFPAHRGPLARLFELHALASTADFDAPTAGAELPEAGDEVGPYRLVRELGRGGFARVFLAEQVDLDGRHVVVKVTTRPSPEPRLLARSRHAHIVEVLSAATTGDGSLQILCMPFLGGATLAAVNAAAGPRRSGRDLLARLDRASAPEYPASSLPRPSRELIARLSYPRAVAWIFARLAEALDHAHARGVGHGDVKPANMLLTADGVPMLFDFNLAVDRRGEGDGAPSGGTLAYMPPERLRALAEGRAIGGPIDLRRADLYSLGLVLVETLTGVAPAVPQADGPGSVAPALARARAGGVTAFADWRGLAMPAGLRPILEKCLAADPSGRFADGRALAEDLDRWRDDLAPAVAPDGAWPVRLGRWARRARVPIAATVLTLVVGGAVAAGASAAFRRSVRAEARAKYDRFLDKDDLGLFGFRTFGSWAPRGGDPADAAIRKLNQYGVVDDPAWRRHGVVSALDGPERDDLELLMLEQIYRLALAWADRPNSEGDWRRALDLLDREAKTVPARPLASLGDGLRARLGLAAAPRSRAATAAPAWIESYLLGVAAEPLRAREAMGHYERAIAARPDLIWPRYRAAAAGWRVAAYDAAAGHLRAALERRPRNAALHTHLASMLLLAGQAEEAGASCDRALGLDPDFAEAYRTRALIDDRLARAEQRRSDGDRFAVLTRFLGPARAEKLDLQAILFSILERAGGDSSRRDELLTRVVAADPSDTDIRVNEANRLARSGKVEEAVVVLDAILREQPAHLGARYNRATYLRRLGRPEALGEYLAIVDDSRFEELYREQPGAILSFGVLTNDLIRIGRIEEARTMAGRGLAESERTGLYLADAHYTMARALAVSAGADASRFGPARERLRIAAGLKPEVAGIYAKDRLFAELRRDDPSFLRGPDRGVPLP